MGGKDHNDCAQNVVFDKLKPFIPKPEDFEILTHILTESSKNYKKIIQEHETEDVIHEAVFTEIMQAWSAFEATDISNDGKIDISEMRFIIYAYEKVKLSNQTIYQYFKERD